MYQLRQIDPGSGGGAIALRLHPPGPRPVAAPAFGKATSARGFSLVTDLGTGIGSAEWLRGLLTCLALCYAALSLAPGLEPLVGPSPPSLTEAQLDEARALSFGPLAYGADTGRRMAPTAAVQTLNDIPERPTLDLTLSLGRGDSFARVLQRAGVGQAEALQVEAMIASAADMAQVKPGTPLTLTLGRRPSPGSARPLGRVGERLDRVGCRHSAAGVGAISQRRDRKRTHFLVLDITERRRGRTRDRPDRRSEGVSRQAKKGAGGEAASPFP